MKKSIIKIFSSVLFSLICTSFACASSEKIAAIVNDKPITSYDVIEMKKMTILLGNISSPDERKLYHQSREVLINQVLIEQKAKELGIKIDNSDIEERIADIEEQNNLPSGKFKSLMAERNINYQYFRDRMTFEILLRRIQQALFPREYVNLDDINQILIDSSAKPTKFALKIFTSNNTSSRSYKKMLKFASSLADCQQCYKIDYKKFATLKDLKEDINELSPLLRATARTLRANENSGVLKTDEGFQIVMVCHREVEDISDKENSIIENSISEHKMSLKMQRFFSNLKKSAYIKIID